ncbi:MAG TPA: TauD/TfdA family dioxygenase [Coxiellaceae bacterium]|nr:TauD/TfdA family dioxygenase [Coxiellaceae bacterium]
MEYNVAISRDLENKGFSIVNAEIETYMSLCESLGEIVGNADANNGKNFVEVSNSASYQKLGFSNKGLFPHTDRSVLESPPDIVSLFCCNQPERGGESILFDSRKIYENEKLRNIFDIQCLFSDESHSDFLFSSVFYEENGRICVRFRNDSFIYVNPPDAMKFKSVCKIIQQQSSSFLLRPNQALFINNKTPFSTFRLHQQIKLKRWIAKLFVNENANCVRQDFSCNTIC